MIMSKNGIISDDKEKELINRIIYLEQEHRDENDLTTNKSIVAELQKMIEEEAEAMYADQDH